MDSIDDIDSNKPRTLDTAQRVSQYLRTSAKRAAQQRTTAGDTLRPDEPLPKEGDSDKLDFSSEFTSQDMGLSSQGGAGLLDWKKRIEDEDEERRRSEDDEEQEKAEEWTSGGWSDKEDAPQDEDAEAVEDLDDDQVDQVEAPPERPPVRFTPSPPATTPSFLPRSLPEQAQEPARPVAPPISAPAVPASPAAPASPTVPTAAETSTPTVFPIPATSAPAAPSVFADRLRPAAQLQLPPSGQLAQVDPNLAMVARRLIANPTDEPGYEECVRLLARFGLGALRMCVRHKVVVEILDEAGFASHPDLAALNLTSEETPSEGAYLVEQRTVLVDRRCLTGKPRFFHPALYYFAHAFDHAQGGETFSSRKAAAVVACYESSTRGASGFDFVDELAAADPVRYFARSVAVYLGRDDCSDALWTHQDLYDFDRSMYEYLQYLFSRLS